MGKRHQVSRRRAYGRRQHEVRERNERPVRDGFDAGGIRVYETEPFDEFLLERLAARVPVTAPRSVLRAPVD